MATVNTAAGQSNLTVLGSRSRPRWIPDVSASRLGLAALALILLGAGSPQSPPTAGALVDPSLYQSIWSVRLGPANVFELGAVLIGSLALFARALAPVRGLSRSRFDLGVLAAVLIAAGLEAVALFRGLPAERFLDFDIERLVVPLLGYLFVTRAIADAKALRLFVMVLAGVLLARACELLVMYGLLGSTKFGTAQGRTALLITEDVLLIGIPVLLAWGALVDRRLTALQSLGAVVLVVSALAVDSLSLRRGALLFLLAALALRCLVLSRRQFVLAGSVCAVAVGFLLALPPTNDVVANAGYAVQSAVGVKSDASTSQRAAEGRDFGRNVNGVDWVVGRGVGTVWRAEEPGVVQVASFGDKETAYIRIGWHAYGLDWLYKFGLFGGALLICGVGAAVRAGINSARVAPDSTRTLVLSLTAMFPFLVLLTLTNLRLGLMAGVILGLLSRAADFYPPATHAHTSPT